MNRVKDYYETAVKFTLIPPEGQYLIGEHFKVSTISDFTLPDDELTAKIFLKVIEQNKYLEFKQFINNYKRKSNGPH